MSKKEEIFKQTMNAFYQWEGEMRRLTKKEDVTYNKLLKLQIKLSKIDEQKEKLNDEIFFKMHDILGLELNEILVNKTILSNFPIFGDKQSQCEDFFHLNATQTIHATGMIKNFTMAFINEHVEE
jgi:hypothetical protein